jgi:hypothetical protein
MRGFRMGALVAILSLALGIGWAVGRLLVPIALERETPGLIWLGAIAFLVVSAVAGAAAYRLRADSVDWRRILAEQRLWESGKLGRLWLRRRRRIADRLDP